VAGFVSLWMVSTSRCEGCRLCARLCACHLIRRCYCWRGCASVLAISEAFTQTSAYLTAGGLDTQIGGRHDDCERHIHAVKDHPLLHGTNIDFKLSSSSGPVNQCCQEESAFDTLMVRQVDELVTLGPKAAGRANVSNTGQHLSPEAFHEQLQQVQGRQDVVLLDARNIYETRIGSFASVRRIQSNAACMHDITDVHVSCASALACAACLCTKLCQRVAKLRKRMAVDLMSSTSLRSWLPEAVPLPHNQKCRTACRR
jgi:predicted sulfurtransferase